MSRFGMYLVDHGVVTPEQIVEALDRQRELQRPIGKIALSQRMLTVHQVFEILNRQADTQQSFGETAIELGYLTADEVGMLLKIEGKERLGEFNYIAGP